jgi:hypothetical protein
MDEMAYIARKPCGCVVAAVAADPWHPARFVEIVAQWVRSGLAVEYVTADYVREHFTRCRCGQMDQHSLVEAAHGS